MNINDELHGFIVINKEFIREVDGTAYTFEHKNTGAKLFFIDTIDDNKVFSISFRTPPYDDTGVAHIVEHSVLCGSRKYPIKEPFVELVKGSLNTFLNAMTFPDKTMYPVASRNNKDFHNLIDVYLDAVFFPKMVSNPKIFMQEGWHYELDSSTDELYYSGVVYNEMKGALSSPDDILESRIMESLYPDNTYGYESGGNPEDITTLTQEMLVDFHTRYYHPSNSYIYLYGDLDIAEKLEYINMEYLSKFNKISIDSKIKRQPEYDCLVRKSYKYPISVAEEAKGKTFIALNFVVGETSDIKTTIALSILEHALLRDPGAPLRQALIDSELGRDVSSIFETNIMQPYFSIILNGSDTDHEDKFYQLVNENILRLVNDGIDRQLLEASISSLEFRFREADFGTYPKGLIYGIAIMRTWLYDNKPESSLYYEEIISELKSALTTNYYEKLLEEVFLKNNHKTLVKLMPSKTIAKEREDKVKKILTDKKKSMTGQEIDYVIKMANQLKEDQSKADSEEALQCIPLVELSDIKKEADELPLDVMYVDGTKILFSDIETNGIIYINMLFDLSKVSQKDLPYVYLLSELLGSVDTKNYSYAEVSMLQNLNTGGISSSVMTFSKAGDTDSFQPKLQIKAKVLRNNLPQLFHLLREILLNSDFSSQKRLQEILDEEIIGMELSLQRMASQVVMSKISSYLSFVGSYNDIGSLPFYRFLQSIANNFREQHLELQETLSRIIPQIFNKNGLIVSVTTKKDCYDDFVPLFRDFLNYIYKDKLPEQKYSWELKVRNEGLTSQSRVQYVAKGANFIRLGYSYTGTFRVLETLLRYDYFWNKIRVQGGAYGVMTQFNRNGIMVFASYRDPNLKKTLDVFDETPDYIRSFEVSQREMDKIIIGTMSVIDTPLTPQMKGLVAMGYYLRGISYEERQRIRDEILNTRQKDIRDLATMIERALAENVICVFGNESKINEVSELFGEVKAAL